MIGHQAVGEEINGIFLESFCQYLDDFAVIKFMEKHLGSMHGTIAYVNDLTRGAMARFPWHIGYNWENPIRVRSFFKKLAP